MLTFYIFSIRSGDPSAFGLNAGRKLLGLFVTQGQDVCHFALSIRRDLRQDAS